MNEQSPHTDIVNDWIIGYLTNSLTPEEMQSLQNWLNVSEENREYFSDMQEVWIAASDEADEQHFDKERAYQLFLEHTESLVRPSLKRKAFTISPWIYVAAMVVIVFFCGTIAFQSGKRVLQNQLTQITVEAPYGSKTKLYLPDGTLVWLNAGSKMSYAQDFGINERSLNLSGEAYFEVAKNPEKRFIVSTSHQSQIEVLGTHFNIEAYEKDDKVLATLVEGKIGFIFTQDNVSKKVLMDPGQKLVYDSRDCKVQLYATSGESEIAWKEGKIIFRNTPLEEGLRMLEKRYNVEFIIKNDRLKGDSFTGTFTNQRLERILEYFQLSSQIRWRYLDSPDIKDEKSKIEIY